MKTDDEWFAWWRDDTAERVALYNFTANVAGVETALLVSRLKYDGAVCLARVQKGLVISQRLTPEGAPRLPVGEVQLDNSDRKLDAWANYVWCNRPFEVLVGDLRWNLDDFRVMSRGMVSDCEPSDDGNTLVISVADRLQQLDSPLSEDAFADGTLKPVALGECPNVTPKWDNVAQAWVYHARAAVGLIAGEARVEARPRTVAESLVTETPATGRFQFLTSVAGAVTCSVFGDNTGGVYRNTVASLVRLIVTAYGKETGRYTDADIDLANFAAFDAAHPQSVGLYPADRMNCIAAIAALASSLQAQMIPSPLGLLRLVQWQAPTSATMAIRPGDYASIKRGNVHQPVAAVKIGYCKNNTPQGSIQSSIPDEHRAMLGLQWRSRTATRPDVAELYRLPSDAVQIDTCLNDGDDAQDEAERRATASETKRRPYLLDAFPLAFLWELGQAVTLYAEIADLDIGKAGQITTLDQDFDTFQVQTEVTI